MEVMEKLGFVNLHEDIYFDLRKISFAGLWACSRSTCKFICVNLLLSGPLSRLYSYKDSWDSWGSWVGLRDFIFNISCFEKSWLQLCCLINGIPSKISYRIVFGGCGTVYAVLNTTVAFHQVKVWLGFHFWVELPKTGVIQVLNT